MTTRPLTSTASAAPALVAVRRTLLVTYLAVAGTVFIVVGVPFDREQVILWACGALALTTVGRPLREMVRLVRDWLPFAVVLLVYDYTRGIADTLGMPVHRSAMATLDTAIGAGTVPTVWLQDHLHDVGGVHWYDVATTLVYNSHFFAVYVIAAVLWARDRARWADFVRRYLILVFAGLATYVLFPAAPPWMAGRDGTIEPVRRISGIGWNALGLHSAETVLTKGQGVVNQVAAVPSLHAAFAAFIAVFFWRRARWPLRVVLGVYPVAMGVALVYSGEHYVADVLLGWIYVALVMWAAAGWERRRGHRRARAADQTRAATT